MRFRAHVSSWDCMDTVHIAAVVYDDDVPSIGERVPVLSTKTVLQGTGEDDPRQWLIDALVAVLEAT